MLNTAKNRKRAPRYVDMISPHGAEVNVTEERAESLVGRGAIAFGDGIFRKWTYAEDAIDGKPEEVDAASSGPVPSTKERTIQKKATPSDKGA